jgi:hypothetical protein
MDGNMANEIKTILSAMIWYLNRNLMLDFQVIGSNATLSLLITHNAYLTAVQWSLQVRTAQGWVHSASSFLDERAVACA